MMFLGDNPHGLMHSNRSDSIHTDEESPGGTHHHHHKKEEQKISGDAKEDQPK
jgi:hypothetical protein